MRTVLQETVQVQSQIAGHGSAPNSNVVSEAGPADLERLAYAVSVAETANCTKGSGVSKNNCFGIMEWPNGERQLKWYNTTQESFDDFKRVWLRGYGGRFPTLADAKKWTGNDRSKIWLQTVKEKY